MKGALTCSSGTSGFPRNDADDLRVEITFGHALHDSIATNRGLRSSTGIPCLQIVEPVSGPARRSAVASRHGLAMQATEGRKELRGHTEVARRGSYTRVCVCALGIRGRSEMREDERDWERRRLPGGARRSRNPRRARGGRRTVCGRRPPALGETASGRGAM
ncbi:hypothetical protein K466DRAFT_400600 [Polyporus arcularius HHB13444]|uniref:Uncharacterized protein n=1 Tax=Polyporus arcularius HHB13444 TaxID=1314778 RepID=A0A5C3PK56_9APHY|nr:hypothetical protein K466DRAFT_400600 [Polyporus arcularius HHB13444]